MSYNNLLSKLIISSEEGNFEKKIFWNRLIGLGLSSNYDFLILFEDSYNRNKIQSFYSGQDSSVRGGNQVLIHCISSK